MGNYWLASLLPLIAVADSPREWGIAGGLFLITMALIKLLERYLPNKRGCYEQADRDRAKKSADVISARDSDGMPRVWFPANAAKSLEKIVSGQGDTTSAVRELVIAQRETTDLMRAINLKCFPPGG